MEHIGDELGKLVAIGLVVGLLVFVASLLWVDHPLFGWLYSLVPKSKSDIAPLVIVAVAIAALRSVDLPGWDNLVLGRYGLARTFWVFYFAPVLTLSMILNEIDSPAIIWTLGISVALWQIVCVIGTWNAATRYRGPTAIKILAKGWVVLFACLAVAVAVPMMIGAWRPR